MLKTDGKRIMDVTQKRLDQNQVCLYALFDEVLENPEKKNTEEYLDEWSCKRAMKTLG